MFGLFRKKTPEEKEREEWNKLDEDYYDPNAETEDENWDGDDDEEDDYDDEIEEPDGEETITSESNPGAWSDSLRCEYCEGDDGYGFPLAWKDDGDAECRYCGAQYTRVRIFEIMDYNPPFKKCFHCNQPYPHCIEWCTSVSNKEKIRRGFDV